LSADRRSVSVLNYKNQSRFVFALLTELTLVCLTSVSRVFLAKASLPNYPIYSIRNNVDTTYLFNIIITPLTKKLVWRQFQLSHFHSFESNFSILKN
jgi:hypothetical protein